MVQFHNMEPQNADGQPVASIISNDPTESLLAPACRQTPFSKYLALTLFIVLPFVGAYVGYRYAPEKVVEVGQVVVREMPLEVESIPEDVSTSEVAIAKGNTIVLEEIPDRDSWQEYQDEKYGFAFAFPLSWDEVDMTDSSLATDENSVKNILIQERSRKEGIIIGVVPLDKLKTEYGCHYYTYEPTRQLWSRSEGEIQHHCLEVEAIGDPLFVNSNYSVLGILSISSTGRNPVTIVVPYSDEFGLSLTVINWSESDPNFTITDVAKSILSTFTFEN